MKCYWKESKHCSFKKNVPVIFPIAASAYSSCKAAVLLAKVSGKLVPKAITVMPATLAFRPTTHDSKFPIWKKIKLIIFLILKGNNRRYII